MRLRVTIGMLMALLVLMMNFPVRTVYATQWYSEHGGEASVTIEAGGPETIAQYTWHTLKLGVKSDIWASATAEGLMYVYGRHLLPDGLLVSLSGIRWAILLSEE